MAITVVADEPGIPSTEVFLQQLSAVDLLNVCASSALTNKGRERRTYCAGFISGVEEATRLHAVNWKDGASDIICPPDNLTARTLAEVYIQYASGNRRSLGRPAAAVAFDALVDAFPCAGRIDE